MSETFDRDRLAGQAAALAANNVRIGTSSWKYPGWRGLLYDDARYVWRGRFSMARFEKLCLAEYAGVFKTVSVDAAYYQFPNERSWQELAGQVPGDFQFALKVTDQITMRRFPRLPRFGARAGQTNEHFLHAGLFQSAFLAPLEPIRSKIGLLMFEFARFNAGDFARGRDFAGALDAFLAQLPRDWRYGVEIRNRTFLEPDYFAVLAQHHVTHIYNSWEAMPPLAEQMALPGSRTTPDLVVARLLLKPGRRYEEAVKLFSPYAEIKEPHPETRAAAARLVREAVASKGRTKAFVFVNNRLEGNALETIDAIVAQANL